MTDLTALIEQYIQSTGYPPKPGQFANADQVVAYGKQLQDYLATILRAVGEVSSIIKNDGAGNAFLANDGTYKPIGAGAIPSYTHTQAVASSSWSVTHNLGFKPNVRVEDSSDRDIIGVEVDYIDDNHLTITFASSTSGKAYLS
jgi:hypothetical protein